jgi:hypothetical protein
MGEQKTLGTGFEKYSKTTRREKFLTEMDRIVPWGELCALIAPVYPKAGDGRPPKELEMMLRVYFLQQWFNLSDPGVEEALYDSVSMGRFAGIDLGEMPVPDESTVLRFPPSVGGACSGREALPTGACVLGAPGHQNWHRHDCRCHDYQRPALHQEQGQAP